MFCKFLWKRQCTQKEIACYNNSRSITGIFFRRGKVTFPNFFPSESLAFFFQLPTMARKYGEFRNVIPRKFCQLEGILTFWIKKYVRNSRKFDHFPGKFAFFWVVLPTVCGGKVVWMVDLLFNILIITHTHTHTHTHTKPAGKQCSV